MPTLNDLGKQVKAKYPGQYDDMSDLELGRRTLAKYPKEYADYAGADTTRVVVRAHDRGMPKKKSNAALSPGYVRATNMIPGAAGTVGSVLGGTAGAVLGAAAGPRGALTGRSLGSAAGADVLGAGGEAIRQLVTEIPAIISGGSAGYEQAGGPASPGEASKQIADVGAQQAQLDAMGQGLGLLGKYVGKGAMGMALKFTPEAAQTAIREGISATRGGVAKLGKLIDEVSGKTRRVVARGRGFLSVPAVATEIQDAVNADLAKSSTALADKTIQAKVNQLRGQFIDQNPSLLDLEKAHIYKQSASKEAAPQFVRLETGEVMAKPSDPVQQLWKLNEARILGEHLDRALGPEYAALNARQHDLLTLKGVLVPDATVRQGTLARVALPAAISGGGALLGEETGRRLTHDPRGALAGAATGALLGSPQGLSMLSLFLTHPLVAQALLRGPQVATTLGAAGQ